MLDKKYDDEFNVGLNVTHKNLMYVKKNSLTYFIH